MRRVPALLLLLPAILLSACQNDAQKVQEHLSRGDDYVKEGKLPEAIIEFKSALQVNPNLADAHFKLAHAYLASQKAREGFWELRETARLDPSNHQAVLEFSQLAILAGEKDEALKQATAVTEADPKNAQAWLVRGQALDSLGRGDDALASYRKAVEVAPDDDRAAKVLARAESMRGHAQEAEALYKKVAERSPGFDSYAELARFYASAGGERDADAEAAFRKAIELGKDEERQQAYAQLASLYVRRKQPDKAYAVLNEGIDKEKEPVALIFLLARLYRAAGNKDKADALMTRSLQASPKDPKVHLVVGAYRARNGDFEGSLEATESALKLDPDNKGAKLQKAEDLLELGMRGKREGAVDESRKIVDGVLVAHPNDPDALLVDAKIKLANKQVSEAVTSLRQALEARPNAAQLHSLLGATLLVQKNFAEARTELGRALELDAGLLDAKRYLAQAHENLGEWDYAVEVGRQYLKERPGDAQVRLLVAQSLVRLNRMDEAQKALEKIPEENRNGEVYYAFGRVAQARKDNAQARKYLEMAQAKLPDNYEILTALLQLDVRAGRVAESGERIDAAVKQKPDDPKLRQLQGMVAAIQGRNDDAEAAFKKAIELDPMDVSGYERLARFYSAQGKLAETTKVYEQALEVNPDKAILHHYLGVLYELQGDRERAIKRYEDAVRLGPDLAEAKNNLAFLYADSGKNLDRALELAQDAKQRLPDNPSVADTLGWVLYKRGVPVAAVGYLKEAEAHTDANDASLGVVRYHLALAYEAAGDPDKALAAVDRSLAAVKAQTEAAKKRGVDTGAEPAWRADARALRDKLQKARTASAGG